MTELKGSTVSDHTESYEDKSVEEIASHHPSAGDAADVEGEEQEGNLEGDEHAEDGGPGAGEDYAGSGF